MKRIQLFSLLTLLAFPVFSQSFTVLSYRMGAFAGHDGTVGLTEYRFRIPGFQMGWDEGVRLGTAFGYHHADFGSDFRFWGNAPMDSWIAGASLTVLLGKKSNLVLGSTARFSRLGIGRFTDQRLFHQTGLSYQRSFRKQSQWSVGLAYRNGVALPVIPIIGFQGRFGGSYSTDIILPSRLYIWKAYSSKRALGVFARYQTTPYPSPVVSDLQNGVLRHRMVRAGLSFDEVLTSRWSIRADVAATLIHDRKLVVGKSTIDVETDPSVVLDIALVYGINAR